jgi:hypothetical protein
MPWLWQVSGWQVGPASSDPQWPLLPPPPHVRPPEHVPHCNSLPQPSPAGPHWMSCDAHVSALQHAPPQTLGVPPPPHVWHPVQVPHWSSLPQPSPAGPQAMFCETQVSGAQVPASG